MSLEILWCRDKTCLPHFMCGMTRTTYNACPSELFSSLNFIASRVLWVLRILSLLHHHHDCHECHDSCIVLLSGFHLHPHLLPLLFDSKESIGGRMIAMHLKAVSL